MRHSRSIGSQFTKHVHVIWCVGTAPESQRSPQSTGRKPSLDTLESATLACYEDGLEDVRVRRRERARLFQRGVADQSGVTSRASTCCCRRLLGNRRRGTAWSIRTRRASTAITWTRQTFEWFPFTPLFNATGQPAISLPLHWSKDGLPMGSQFVGRFGDEATLLQLAAQIEQAAPWAGRHAAADSVADFVSDQRTGISVFLITVRSAKLECTRSTPGS